MQILRIGEIVEHLSPDVLEDIGILERARMATRGTMGLVLPDRTSRTNRRSFRAGDDRLLSRQRVANRPDLRQYDPSSLSIVARSDCWCSEDRQSSDSNVPCTHLHPWSLDWADACSR